MAEAEMTLDILRLIRNNDGELTWYQLDRSLSYEGTHLSIINRLIPLLKQLEQNGFIRSEGNPSQPRYWIGDAGRQALADNPAYDRSSPTVVDHPLYHPDAAKHFPK
ncbi:MAG: hypothetical protein M3430_03710 [Acidobacteriota bacterium]|nr:hypothetical protein [Acidobacteriota bacterium]